MKKKENSDYLLQRPNLYDYLKLVAIVTMIIDHVGYYLFPEFQILRWIGRFAFPLFLFLVGFNHKYQFRPILTFRAFALWGYMILLYYYTGVGSFTANILVVIVLVRGLLRFLETRKKDQKVWWLIVISSLSLLLHPRLKDWLDYGSLWLIFALWGMFASQKSVFHFFVWWFGLIWLWIQNMLIFQFGYFEGDDRWWALLFLGYGIVYLLLALLAHKNQSLRFSKIWDRIVVWIAKHALLIYVVHIVLLGLIAWGRRMWWFTL